MPTIFAPLTVTYGEQVVTVEAVIDTGSAGTAIDTSQILLDLSRPGIVADMVGIGSAHQVLIQNATSVSLVDVVINDFPIEFGDFSGKFSVNGIIGGDLLKQLGIRIDYARDEIRSIGES